MNVNARINYCILKHLNEVTGFMIEFWTNSKAITCDKVKFEGGEIVALNGNEIIGKFDNDDVENVRFLR